MSAVISPASNQPLMSWRMSAGSLPFSGRPSLRMQLPKQLEGVMVYPTFCGGQGARGGGVGGGAG